MVDRLFQIVYTLMNKERTTAQELAQQLEVSKRTILRDIEKLSLAGIPVYMNRGKGGGIFLLPDYVIDRTLLTVDEKEQILSSLQALCAVGYQEEQAALTKLQSLFGKDSQEWIEIAFDTWGEASKEEAIFLQMKEAILSHRMVTLQYASNRGEYTKRKVKPLKLCFKGQAWYLYGYCMLRKDYRFFKLHRMQDVVTLAETFPEEAVGKVLVETEYAPKESLQLKVKISSKMAFRAYDELTGITQLEDGSLLCEFTIRNQQGLTHYLSSFGPDLEVIEPVELREQMKEMSKKMAEIYQ